MFRLRRLAAPLPFDLGAEFQHVAESFEIGRGILGKISNRWIGREKAFVAISADSFILSASSAITSVLFAASNDQRRPYM